MAAYGVFVAGVVVVGYACDMVAVVSVTVGYSSIQTICKSMQIYVSKNIRIMIYA